MSITAKLWNLLRAPFAWRNVREEGVWLYQVNDVTGERRAIRIIYGGFGAPTNSQWLAGGNWERKRPAPPPRFGSEGRAP